MRTDRWQASLLVILGYTILALALTAPLVAHFGSHVPGDGVDDPPLTWNLWWVQHAILDVGINPFQCDYLFYPLGINLAFYTLTVLNGVLSIPLQATAGLIPASNVLLLSSFVLSGYGAYLLARYLLAEEGESRASYIGPVAACTAGLVYAFSSNKLFYAALGQWNIASTQWTPFYILYLFKMGTHPRRWRYPVLVALFFLLQAYAELTYASFLALFTFIWLIWRLAIPSRTPGRPRVAGRAAAWASRRRTLANLLLVGAVSALGLVPILTAMIPDVLAEGSFLAEGGGFADVFSADLLGFLIPTMHHPLFGSWVERFDFDHTVGQHLYLGYSVLALALLGTVRRWRSPVIRFWAVSTLLFWILTLGPRLRVNGHDTGLPLPFALVARLPVFEGNRYPSRYGVLVVLSLAVLVAFGVQALLNRKARPEASSVRVVGRAVVPPLLVAGILLFEHLSAPLPLSDMRVPVIYDTIAATPSGKSTLLDLPVAWRNGFRVTGTQDPIIMFEQFYQTSHRQRLLAGNTSRNPPLKFQYFVEAPVINTLIALETGHTVDPPVLEADRALSAEVLRFFNIETVIIHRDATGSEMVTYVEGTMPVERFYQDEQIVAYQVDLPPWPDRWTITPDARVERLSFAEGWGEPGVGVRWAQRKAARLLVPLNGQGQRLAFRAYAPGAGQSLQIKVNGQTAATVALSWGWGDYEVTLPAGMVREGLNEVWLRFAMLYPASGIQISPRHIGPPGEPAGAGTGSQAPVNLVVQSAGLEVGDFGHVYLDGQQVSPNGRGYNVAVIHPQSGQVTARASFDTHLDHGASQAFAAFLRGVPQGHLVAVAAADEASRLLGPEAVEALQGIGAAVDLRDRFRWGHAIIGVQGASAGTAAEAADWMHPVTLVVGEGATEPHLAAAFAHVAFIASPDP